MIKQGFALERVSTGKEFAWWETIPPTVRVPGASITVDAATAGWKFEDYRIVAKDKEFPDPPPQRRMIEKAVIVSRLTDAQLEAAISLMTIRQQERWRMPGYPSVYVDDAEVIGLIRAVGADPEKVLA
jgi:hypothetical protein